VLISPSWSDFLTEVNRKVGLNPNETGAQSVYRWFKDKQSIPWYSKQPCTPLRHPCAAGNITTNSHVLLANKAPDNYRINSKLLWDCHQSFIKIWRVQFVWVLNHWEMKKMKMLIRCQKLDLNSHLWGLVPAHGISVGVAMKAVMDRMNTYHKNLKNL
jgi:hypothetical protein